MKKAKGILKTLPYIWLSCAIVLGLMTIVGTGGGGGDSSTSTTDGEESEIAPTSLAQVVGTLEVPAGVDDSEKQDADVYIIGQESQGVTTDISGNFTLLVSVASASSREAGSRAAEEGAEYDLIAISQTKKYGKKIDGVIVYLGQTTTVPPVTITKTGSITGNVTLQGPSDHTGIMVYIPGTSFIAMTDSSGDYTISQVPEGTYDFLRAEKDGYNYGVLSNITVESDTTTAGPSMELLLSTGPEGQITLGGGDLYSNSLTVDLTIAPSEDAVLMMISEDADFIDAQWEVVQSTATYAFSEDGLKTLYIRFADANGLETTPISASFIIDTTGGSTLLNVSASAGDGEVTISWDSVSGATSYNIYWSTSTGVTTADYEGKIEDITETSYTHTGLTDGTTYCYVVTVENTYWESGESSEVSATPHDSPTATISSPSDGSAYFEDVAISFEGSGDDSQDGTLTGDSLVWTSDIDGQIGTGTSFSYADLSVGTHTITLTVTDSDRAAGNDSITVAVVAHHGMTFELISAGTFTMGSPTDELGRWNDETQHEVTLTKSFYMQTTEVTQGQWRAVMGSNPSDFSDCGDDCPVETVSWDDVQEFIEKLNQMEGTDKYRLPTEAEWEYASRAGSTTAFANGEITNIDCDDPNLDQMAWYCGNADITTHPVAQKDPNDWGLYDMHGNVWEWCEDWYGAYSGPVTDPTGPSSGTIRVLRGGSWDFNAMYCRSASRYGLKPDNRSYDIGFRVARAL